MASRLGSVFFCRRSDRLLKDNGGSEITRRTRAGLTPVLNGGRLGASCDLVRRTTATAPSTFACMCFGPDLMMGRFLRSVGALYTAGSFGVFDLNFNGRVSDFGEEPSEEMDSIILTSLFRYICSHRKECEERSELATRPPRELVVFLEPVVTEIASGTILGNRGRSGLCAASFLAVSPLPPLGA